MLEAGRLEQALVHAGRRPAGKREAHAAPRNAVELAQRLAQIARRDGPRREGDVDALLPQPARLPVVAPAHEMRLDAVHAELALVGEHHVHHALGEVAGDDLVASLRERRRERAGAAPHVEHGLPFPHPRELEEPRDVALLRPVLHGKALGLGIPNRGIIRTLPRNLQPLPFLVPIGGSQQRSERLCHFLPFA